MATTQDGEDVSLVVLSHHSIPGQESVCMGLI